MCFLEVKVETKTRTRSHHELVNPLIGATMQNDSSSGTLNNGRGEEKYPHGNKSHVSGGLVSPAVIYY